MLDVGAVSAGLAALLLCVCSLQLAFGARPTCWIALGLRHLGNEHLSYVRKVVQHHFPPPTCCSRELAACIVQEDTGVILPVAPANFCKELAYGILLLCEEWVNLSPVGQALGFDGVHKGKWSLAM